MNKLYMKLYKVILVILAINTIYCFGMSVWEKRTMYDYNSFILAMGVCVYISIVGMIFHFCKKLSSRQLTYIVVIMLGIYSLFALVFGLGIKSERPADIFSLHNAAVSYIQTGTITNIDYFSVYPMQLNYAYILIVVYKIGSCFGIADYRTSGTLFGIALLLFSAILVYHLAYKIKDKYLGVTALFIFITNPIFWIYPSYYYTDLIGMVFLMLPINIALCVNSNNTVKKNLLLSILMGMVVFIGYKMRATAAISGIAALILGIIKLHGSNKAERNTLIKYFLFWGGGCIIAFVLWKLIESHFAIELNENKKFPVVHWIMMGLSEESGGMWSSKLWGYTNSFPTYQEKISGDIAAIKASLSNMGILGLIELILNKLVVIWSDGMTALTANFKTSVHYGALYEYTIGNKNAITCYGTQIIRSSLLLCAIPYIFCEIKNKLNRKSILAITFFGYMLFYCFWEVHEKYVLMFLPLLVIMAAYGISILTKMLENFQRLVITGKKKYECNKMDIYNLFRRLSLGIIVITILLSLLYYKSMVVQCDKKYNFIVYQSSTSGSIGITHDNVVKQTFWADKKFNGIYIRFLNNTVPEEQNYTFSLYDNKNSLVYTEKFTAGDIGNDTYHAFYFDEVNVDNEHEFYLEITADEQYNHTIEICNVGNNSSDYYSRGKCFVSGVDRGDITFRVYYIETSSYYSKLFYFIMIFAILLIEGIIYYSFWSIPHSPAAEY